MRPGLASIALRAVVQTMGDREPVEYRRGQVVHELRGVFQATHQALDPETGVQVRSTQPVLLINGENLPLDPKQGDTVVVRSTTYRVRDAQPDGHTGWLLMLHRTNTGAS